MEILESISKKVLITIFKNFEFFEKKLGKLWVIIRTWKFSENTQLQFFEILRDFLSRFAERAANTFSRRPLCTTIPYRKQSIESTGYLAQEIPNIARGMIIIFHSRWDMPVKKK